MTTFQLTSTLLVFGLFIVHTKGQMGLQELIDSTFNRKSNIQTTTEAVQSRSDRTSKSCGQGRECVPKHLCLNGTINIYGVNLIGIRIDASVCSSDEICCNLPNKRHDSVSPPQVPPVKPCGQGKECVPKNLCLNGTINIYGVNLIGIRIDASVCSSDEICCNLPNTRNTSVSTRVLPAEDSVCGWRNVEGVVPRISDGDADNEAHFGEFPWMVAIMRAERSCNKINESYVCGGSIIAANVVLTAHHCTISKEANQLVVRAGEWDIQNTNEIYAHVVKHVREIIRHEKFNKGAFHNDVALLILEEAFTWQPNIRPICLPEPNTSFDRSRCFATGWGVDKYSQEAEYQATLKKVDLPIVPHATCQDKLRKTRLSSYYVLDESFICAGGEKDKDTCKGDGGSPLVCPIPGSTNRYYQAGIVSFGIDCGNEDVPGVYASVSHLRSWISDKLTARIITFEDFTP